MPSSSAKTAGCTCRRATRRPPRTDSARRRSDGSAAARGRGRPAERARARARGGAGSQARLASPTGWVTAALAARYAVCCCTLGVRSVSAAVICGGIYTPGGKAKGSVTTSGRACSRAPCHTIFFFTALLFPVSALQLPQVGPRAEGGCNLTTKYTAPDSARASDKPRPASLDAIC